MSKHGIDPGGWQGDWPDPDQRVIRLANTADPIPADARKDNRGLDRSARDLESRIEIDEHAETADEPLDTEELTWPQRIWYVEWPPGYAPRSRPRLRHSDPGHVVAGFVFWQAGSWWWRPSWHGADDPNILDMGLNQEPAVALDVDDEREALEHARRRVAWIAAVRHAEYLAGDE